MNQVSSPLVSTKNKFNNTFSREQNSARQKKKFDEVSPTSISTKNTFNNASDTPPININARSSGPSGGFEVNRVKRGVDGGVDKKSSSPEGSSSSSSRLEKKDDEILLSDKRSNNAQQARSSSSGSSSSETPPKKNLRGGNVKGEDDDRDSASGVSFASGPATLPTTSGKNEGHGDSSGASGAIGKGLQNTNFDEVAPPPPPSAPVTVGDEEMT